MLNPKKDYDYEPFKGNISVYKRSRTIYFFDDVDHQSVCQAIIYLDEIENEKDKEDPINLVICSNGGEIHAGLALYDRIRQSICPVYTIAKGLVASMAVIVYLAGDKRFTAENTRFMNHQGSLWTDGKVSDIKIELAEVEKLEEICLDIISERTTMPVKKIKNYIKVGNDYFGAERAISEGFCHEIISNEVEG